MNAHIRTKTTMPSPWGSEFLTFRATRAELDRQKWLESHGFEFEGGCPFTVNMYGYIHEDLFCTGIDNLCRELSRQVFRACRARHPVIPPPTRYRHDYHRVKMTFNIATATFGPKPQTGDVEVILTAIMWHLTSPRGLKPVDDIYEKVGRCRGQNIVVLRIRVVPEGAKDCVYFFPQDARIEADWGSSENGWVFI